MSTNITAKGRTLAFLKKFDDSIEPVLMVLFYTALALIISIEVARRYFMGEQTQWGSVVSIYCFIWLSWLGCSYHVKHRTHLRFGEVRKKFPPHIKTACYILDDVIWLLLAWIVIKASLHLIETQNRLGNVIEGTQSIPLSVATAAVPIGWLLVSFRAVQDIFHLVIEARSGQAPERKLVVID